MVTRSAVAAIVLAALCSASQAGRSVRVVKRVVPLSYSPIVYAQVGAHLQRAAVETRDLRNHPDERAELEYLRGFKAAIELALEAPQQIAGEPPIELEQPPSVVVANCAKCHSGDEPKGGLDLSRPEFFAGDVHAETQRAIMRRILSDDPAFRMPPPELAEPLTDQQTSDLIYELFGD